MLDDPSFSLVQAHIMLAGSEPWHQQQVEPPGRAHKDAPKSSGDSSREAGSISHGREAILLGPEALSGSSDMCVGTGLCRQGDDNSTDPCSRAGHTQLPSGIQGSLNVHVLRAFSELQGALWPPASTLPGCRISVRFAEADNAPPIPAPLFARLLATTLRVPNTAASDIGNTLLDFFEGFTAASVTKVSRAKFCIHAIASVDGLMCKVKVRTYSEDSGTHAVEFQRRTGSSVVFSAIYWQAVQYLATRLSESLSSLDGPKHACPVLPRSLGLDAGDASMLKDLVPDDRSPASQAETAASLSDMAAGLQELLHRNLEEVVCPPGRTQCSHEALCIEDEMQVAHRSASWHLHQPLQ